MSKCLTFKVSHIFREGNKCVDSLGSMGVDLKQDFSWYENTPEPDCISPYFFMNRFGLLCIDFSDSIGFGLVLPCLFVFSFCFFIPILRKHMIVEG